MAHKARGYWLQRREDVADDLEHNAHGRAYSRVRSRIESGERNWRLSRAGSLSFRTKLLTVLQFRQSAVVP